MSRIMENEIEIKVSPRVFRKLKCGSPIEFKKSGLVLDTVITEVGWEQNPYLGIECYVKLEVRNRKGRLGY